MARKYDDFDEGDSEGFFDQVLNIVSNRKREFAIVSVSAAVILLGLVVWGSYPDSEDAGGTESVPIVRADAGDYKTTPDNPGGMEIPYRDSTVFSSVDGARTDGGTENILADEGTEEPLPRSQLFAGLNTEGDQPGGAPVASSQDTAVPSTDPVLADRPKGEVEETMAKVEPVEAPTNDAIVKEAIGVPAEELNAGSTKTAAATPPAAALKAVTTTKPKVEEIEKAEAPAPKAEAAAKVEPAAGTTASKVKPGGYYVQLASVKSTSGASAEYKKMQAKYTSLSGVEFRTQEANLGEKGTFYRIQAGPMSKESASSICGGIKGKGGSCLVVAK